MKRFACWFVTGGWFSLTLFASAAHGLVGCTSVPQEAPVVPHKVVYQDTTYTDGVREVIEACGAAVVKLSDDHDEQHYMFQYCLFKQGATL